MILISFKFSTNSGKSGLRYWACHLQISAISILQLYLSIYPNARRKITLKLYPPPTLLGKTPSHNAKSKALECSAIEYNAAKGKISFFNFSTPTPSFLEISFHDFSASSISSIFKKEA